MRRLIPVLVKKAECVKIGWRKSAKQTDSVVREKNQISHRIFLQVKVNSCNEFKDFRKFSAFNSKLFLKDLNNFNN